MPARFNLYSAWIDPYFYVWAAVFFAALFAMVYSIRRYLELKNAADFGEEEPQQPALPGTEENPFLEQPAEEPSAMAEEKTLVLEPGQQQEFLAAAAAAQQQARPEPAAGPAPEPEPAQPAAQAAEDHTKAENFVRGIYAGISDLDERMKGIEAALSKGRVNNDFAVQFLEDILQDIENLDKSKIKARIEYLLSDLKK